MNLINGRWLALGALSLLLCSACGGLLEIDDLEFTGIPGAGGAAGSSAGGTSGATGGDAGSGNAGSAGAAGTGASAGAAGTGASAGAAGTGASAGAAGSSGSAGSAGNSTGGTGGCDLGSEYNDANSLDCFSQQLAGGSVEVNGGELRITPAVQPWYGQAEGAFFYQTVGTADFAAISRLRVESRSTPPTSPVTHSRVEGSCYALRPAAPTCSPA